MQDSLRLKGRYMMECYAKEGNLKWISHMNNLITVEGLNHLLNVVLAASTQKTTWYCGIAETNTAAVSTMTYAIPSFTESTAYDEAARPTYTESAAVAASITNSSNKAVFTINATKTIYGAALFSSNVKGDVATTAGVLFSYALLSTSRAVIASDVINLTYIVSAS